MSKIRYVWLYLFTGLLDFLQVWRACKGKAAALHKCLSSLQSRAGKRQTTKPQGSSYTLPWPAFPPSSAGEGSALCTARSCFPKQSPGSSQPLPWGTRGHKGTWCRCSGAGCCVSEMLPPAPRSTCRALMSFIWFVFYEMGWTQLKNVWFGVCTEANIDFSFWEVKTRREISSVPTRFIHKHIQIWYSMLTPNFNIWLCHS